MCPRRGGSVEPNASAQDLSQQVALLQQELAAAHQELVRSEMEQQQLLQLLSQLELAETERAKTGSRHEHCHDDSEAAILREQVALLQGQLRVAHETASGDISSSDWDGTLESAEVALRELTERLMAGDEQAEPEYERWALRMSKHPDHLAAERRKVEAWEAKERPKRTLALDYLRSVVPADILRTTRGSLQQRNGMTE